MKLIFTLFFFILLLQGKATKIEGQKKEYAGKELVFFKYINPVSLEKEQLFTIQPDASGNFSVEVKVEEPVFIFSDFGIYRGMLVIEPGETIRILLPPVREKSFAEEKNPYFQPLEFWFATETKNHLNDRIAKFDALLNRLTDKYFNQLYFSQSRSAYDSINTAIEKEFGMETQLWLQQHIRLKMKAVEVDAFRLHPAKVSQALQVPSPAFRTSPAYIEFLEKTFAGRLSFEVKSTDGNNVRKAVSENNISFFQDFIKTKYNLSSPTSDLVLLKMLHDGFYSGDFSRELILKMLKARHFTQNPDRYIRSVASGVIAKLEHLQMGTKAPAICLINTAEQKICTNEKSDKFKYLFFADIEMVVVREHLKYLTKTAEQFGKHLDIFIILRNTELSEMKKFLDDEKIPGYHLLDKKSEYIELYRVKSFPASFLLNEKHEVVFQETKAPLDGFELQFGNYLRNELFRRQGNQSR